MFCQLLNCELAVSLELIFGLNLIPGLVTIFQFVMACMPGFC